MNTSKFFCSNEDVMKGAKIITNSKDVPDVVKIAIKQATLKKLRDERNELLIETDKYMLIPDLPDINTDKIEELKVYRQQLRDYINFLPDINCFVIIFSIDIITHVKVWWVKIYKRIFIIFIFFHYNFPIISCFFCYC